MIYTVGYEFRGQKHTTDIKIVANAKPKSMDIRGNFMVIKLDDGTQRRVSLDPDTGKPIRMLKRRPSKIKGRG